MADLVKNTRIWDGVFQTDPKHTKPVSLGRRTFTSIDAMYQVKRCTEVFGPAGKGWGYIAEHSVEKIDDDVVAAICDVRVWWTEEGDTKAATYGPVRGMNWIRSIGKNGVVHDEDAPKKAMTDALTKALSHLGFSADVFLGLYDDNKYVNRVKEEIAIADAMEARDELHGKIEEITTEPALEALYNEHRQAISKYPQQQQQETLGRFGLRRKAIKEGAKAA